MSKSTGIFGKVLIKHVYNCSAVQLVKSGDWNSAWYFDGGLLWRDKNGSKHGSGYMFLTLKCNNESCQAEAIIRTDRVLDIFNQEVKGNNRMTRQEKITHDYPIK